MAFSVQTYKLLESAQIIAKTHGANGVYTSDLLRGLVYKLREDKSLKSMPQGEVFPTKYSKAAIYALKLAGKEAMADRCPLQLYHVLLGMTLVEGKAKKFLLWMELDAEKLREQVFHVEKKISLSESIIKRIREIDIALIDYKTRSIKEPLSPYEEVMWVDSGIYPLVSALNRIGGVRTSSSCEGHRKNDPASVNLECPVSFTLLLKQITKPYEGFVMIQIGKVNFLETCKCKIEIHYRGVKEILYRIQREMIKRLEDLGLLTEHSRIAFIPLRNWSREYSSQKRKHQEKSMRKKRESKIPRCSWCGRDTNEVKTLISAKPAEDLEIYICEKCVLKCVKILGEKELSIFSEMLEIIKKAKAK